MRRLVIVLGPLVVLAACGGSATEETTRTVTKDGVTTTTVTSRQVGRGERSTNATASSGLRVDSDKIKADVELPNLTFGGDTLDLDGMKLYPKSTVNGMHVHAVDRPGAAKGEMVVDFTSPAAPSAVARHMADEARHAGFVVETASATQIVGSKQAADETKRLAVSLSQNGNATVGHLTMAGDRR